MNTGVQGVLLMYAIFRCALDFAHNFSPMMPTTLNCGATSEVTSLNLLFARSNVFLHWCFLQCGHTPNDTHVKRVDLTS